MIDRWRTKKFKATKFIQIPDQQKFHFITKKNAYIHVDSS